MQLTPHNVEKIFLNCLFDKKEDSQENTKNAIFVEGIISDFGFNPKKIELHKNEIIELLSHLPDKFKQSFGGGWSFPNACETDTGKQWTGLHRNMEQLFALGLAINKVKCLMPKNMWKILPGGMPYYVVLD